jgi:hypothetical protein
LPKRPERRRETERPMTDYDDGEVERDESQLKDALEAV